jgi:hypothetical protein
VALTRLKRVVRLRVLPLDRISTTLSPDTHTDWRDALRKDYQQTDAGKDHLSKNAPAGKE